MSEILLQYLACSVFLLAGLNSNGSLRLEQKQHFNGLYLKFSYCKLVDLGSIKFCFPHIAYLMYHGKPWRVSELWWHFHSSGLVAINSLETILFLLQEKNLIFLESKFHYFQAWHVNREDWVGNKKFQNHCFSSLKANASTKRICVSIKLHILPQSMLFFNSFS